MTLCFLCCSLQIMHHGPREEVVRLSDVRHSAEQGPTHIRPQVPCPIVLSTVRLLGGSFVSNGEHQHYQQIQQSNVSFSVKCWKFNLMHCMFALAHNFVSVLASKERNRTFVHMGKLQYLKLLLLRLITSAAISLGCSCFTCSCISNTRRTSSVVILQVT